MREILACILLIFAFASLSFADTSGAEPSFDAVIVLDGATENVIVSRSLPMPERLFNVTGTDHAPHITATAESFDEMMIMDTANLPFEVGWRSS